MNPLHAREARAFSSAALPVVTWDGRTPTSLIAQIETNLAAGLRFVVLAPVPPTGRARDRGFLEGWWRAVQPRLSGRCGGWATIVPGADANAGHLPCDEQSDFADFPVRTCADRADAMAWLRMQLDRAAMLPSLQQ